MVGGSGPTRGGEAAPLRALALGQIGQTLAGERHRRNPIGLRPEFRAVRLGPGGEGLEIVVVAEFAEGEAPIVADGASRGANVAGQGGQVWRQVIAAPLLELRHEIAGPIRFVYLQAVAEDGERRRLPQRL